MAAMTEKFTRQRSEYDNLSIPTVTALGRGDYLNVYTLIRRASLLKDEMELDTTEPLKIAEVACSSGQNTWLLAAGLAVQDIPFTIRGYDINPSAIRCTTRRYLDTKDRLAKIVEQHCLPAAIPDLFEQVTPEHIKPTAELRKNDVRFSVADLRHDELEPMHLIIANTVLRYFRGDNEAAAAQNLARVLPYGGVLTTNDGHGTTHDALLAENFQKCTHPSVFNEDGFYWQAQKPDGC